MQDEGRVSSALDVLFLHVHKRNNFSWPIGQFSFILYPPVGLLGLADYLRQQNLSARVFHLAVEQKLDSSTSPDSILSRHPAAIVGLDLHWHFQAYDVIEVARQIRRAHPGTPILLGGITASLFADEILREFPFIDFVIRGDAEIPLRDLIREHKSGKNYGAVPNLVYRSGLSIRQNPITYVANGPLIDSIRFTDFTLMENYQTYIRYFSRYIRLHNSMENLQDLLFLRFPSFPVLIGRGCAFDCSFCGGSREAHMQIGARPSTTVRSRSAVLDSIRDLENLGFGFACLASDCIPPHQADDFYTWIFDAMAKENIRIGLEVERNFLPSVRFLDSFARLPRKDSSITLSPHTHNEELRRRNHLHRYSNEELDTCLNEMENRGVPSLICFTCGLPFESHNDLTDMVLHQRSLQKRFKHVHIRTAIIEIEPGSGISRNPDRYDAQPERSTFLDFYRYHGHPGRNHWTALGYERAACPSESDVRELYCRQFCRRFGGGWMNPILCKSLGHLREAGLFPILDRVLSVGRNSLLKHSLDATNDSDRP